MRAGKLSFDPDEPAHMVFQLRKWLPLNDAAKQ